MAPQRHLTTCPLCEASCGLVVETDGRTVTSIRGDELDPLSRGHLCPKAVALKDLHEDPDRLRRPLLREGNTHRELSWDEAIELAATRLNAVRSRHGRDAIAVYLGNPVIHNLGAMALSPLLTKALGTRNRFSAGSVDQLPQMVAATALFGHQLLVPVPDLERTDLLLVFGANPAASNGSLMTAPGITDRLDAIAGRGRVVLFDPRRTESTRHASEHVFIRPGTDALAMLAMLHVLFAEKLVDLGRLAPSIDGLERLAAIATTYPPERVAARTGVPVDTLRRLARELGTTPRAAVYGRMGISTQAHGTIASWLVFALNIVTGHLDVPGGVMFPTPAIDALSLSAILPRATFGRRKSRVRGLPEFSGEYPIATLADEIETPGEGQVRALLTVAGNPVLSTPDGKRLARAIAGLDSYVAIDPYLNETTRLAHLILPPASPLERAHYDLALYHFAVRNVARYTRPVFARPADARADFEIMAALSKRLLAGRASGGWKSRLRSTGQRLFIEAVERFGLERVLDLALRAGPRRLSLKRLLDNPHGLDLGPLEETLPARLQTPNKRIGLVPDFVPEALAALDRELASTPTSLELIGRRHLRSNNSWMHNSQRLMKGKPRCTLMMHPSDAAARALTDGAEVEVRSRTGAITVALELTDTIMPGVVSLPHGFGHTDRSRLSVASAYPGASHNDLTDTARLEVISGNAAFSGTPVEVSATTAS